MILVQPQLNQGFLMEHGGPADDSVIQERKFFSSEGQYVGFFFGITVGVVVTLLAALIFTTLKSL